MMVLKSKRVYGDNGGDTDTDCDIDENVEATPQGITREVNLDLLRIRSHFV